jgi:transcriptional regulator with XRE-family HTH domain
MDLETLRVQCGWSKNEMARQAGIDANTLLKAFRGQPVSIATADKLATAISRKLGQTIRATDIEGLNFN